MGQPRSESKLASQTSQVLSLPNEGLSSSQRSCNLQFIFKRVGKQMTCIQESSPSERFRRHKESC
eukprot:6282568-Amphidinium_carterae.1